MTYRTMNNELRTTISVRLSPEDLTALDALVDAGHTIDVNPSREHWPYHAKTRAGAMRLAIREAARRKTA